MAEIEYYRYFREPHHFSSYSSTPQTCEICGLQLPGYEGPFYGPVDVDFVCEPCLSGGSLADRGLSTNDSTDLIPDLTRLNPKWPPERITQTAKLRAMELEQRTPLILTWQPLLWPTHCGDYCCYLREVGKADLDEMAPDGQGQEFFARHLSDVYEADVEYIREIWDGIRPDKSPDRPLTWSQSVYLFQCLSCGRYIIDWDCD